MNQVQTQFVRTEAKARDTSADAASLHQAKAKPCRQGVLSVRPFILQPFVRQLPAPRTTFPDPFHPEISHVQVTDTC